MTLEEFLTDLRLYAGGWHNTLGILRRRRVRGPTRVTECPFTAVCNERLDTTLTTVEAFAAADLLGLEKSDAAAIMLAADEIAYGPSAGRKSKLRIRLEEATKISP